MSKSNKHSIRETIINLKERIKRKKNGTWILYTILRATVILFAIRAMFVSNFEYLALCILVLILFLVPSFMEKKLNIEIPSTLEKIILLFTYAAEILGEIQAFYLKIPWWDTMLHTLNGFLCAAIGFALVDLLNDNKKIKFQLSPIFFVIVAISFSMTVGVVWEFFEFGMDCIFNLDMQKDKVVNSISSVLLNQNGENIPVIIDGITSEYINGKPLPINGHLDIGLMDTMKDLIVNFIGAVIVTIFGYNYVASKGKDKFATQFIPKSTTDTEQEDNILTDKSNEALETATESSQNNNAIDDNITVEVTNDNSAIDIEEI